MKISLQFKFAITFFVVMFISSIISITILLVALWPSMTQSAENQIVSTVSSMKQLESQDLYSTEEIISICVSDQNVATVLQPKSGEYYRVKIDAAENSCYIEKDKILPSVVGYSIINGDYIRVSNDYRENLYMVAFFIIIITMIVCMILGSILIIPVSRGILKPVRSLSNATSFVARGDFRVRVKEPRDKELGKLVSSFNKMAQELSGIETLRVDFISNVSHEFKTPLASIQGFAKLLQDDTISEEERRDYTQIIINETERLSKLTSDILRLSKLENQNTISDKKRFSIDEQIRKILLVLEPAWTKKNIDLDLNLDDVYYFGNEELMGQIWQNIINNAIKFTPEGGKIGVRLFCTEKNITVRVSDNGPSISPEIEEKIFDKFYQGDRSRKTEGNGLGLALVKRIVDLCGGKIYVENLYDGGVCFVVELPYVISDMM
ncbi:MAG: HAMP domain-containing histidine kinase [Ruminococcus sp.]|nr:HAMP domain-containing histidine kinase [Ruminococcus sp.]